MASDGLTAHALAGRWTALTVFIQLACSEEASIPDWKEEQSGHSRSVPPPSLHPLGAGSDPTYHPTGCAPDTGGRVRTVRPARQYHSDRFIPTLNDQGSSLSFRCLRTHCCLLATLLRGAYPTFDTCLLCLPPHHTGAAPAKLETFPQGSTPCPRDSGRTLAAQRPYTFSVLALSRSNARGGRSSTLLVEGHTTLTLARLYIEPPYHPAQVRTVQGWVRRPLVTQSVAVPL